MKSWMRLALALVVVLGLAVIVFLVFSPSLWLLRWCTRASDVLEQSRAYVPDGMTEQRWVAMLRYTDYAIGNCLASPSYINDWDAMRRFRREGRKRLRVPMTPESVAWFWDGVEAVSRNGKDYAERYRPYPYFFTVSRSEEPGTAEAAAGAIGKLPASASNVLYVASEIRPDLGYLQAYRFDAPEADCVVHATTLIEHNNRDLPDDARMQLTLNPLDAGVSTPDAPFSSYGIGELPWFDTGARKKGYWGLLSADSNEFFVIDTERGRFYGCMAW